MAGIAPIACVVVNSARAGWYPDPTGRYAHRFHNGRAWTADVADAGERFVDPLGTAMPAAPDTPPVATGGRNGPATAAMVLGIIAVTIAWLPFLVVLGVLLAVPAIAFGIGGLRRSEPTGAGRSFAIVGLATGGSAIAAAVIGVVLTIVVLDALEAYRSPADHETRTIDCSVDDGTAVFTAELTNVDDQPGDFAVLVTFVRPGTDNAHRSARVSLEDVPPGATERFEVRRPVTLDDVDCRIARVDGPLPFGIPLD